MGQYKTTLVNLGAFHKSSKRSNENVSNLSIFIFEFFPIIIKVDLLSLFLFGLCTSLWGRTKPESEKYERETVKMDKETEKWKRKTKK